MSEELRTNQTESTEQNNNNPWGILTNSDQNTANVEVAQPTNEVAAEETGIPTNAEQSFEDFITDDSLSESEQQTTRFEQEATGENYNNFAYDEFSRLLGMLDNKNQQDAKSQDMINAGLAVVSTIMGTALELAPTKPEDLFNNIRKANLDAAQEARESGKEDKAHAYDLQAHVTDYIEGRCHLYMTETHNANANRATEAALDAASTDNQTVSLPGDAIK